LIYETYRSHELGGVHASGDNADDLLFPAHAPNTGAFTRVVKSGASTRRSGRKRSGPPSGGGKHKGGGSASRLLLTMFFGAAAISLVAYAARKNLAEVVAETWLRSQGVAADIKIDRLSLTQMSGRALLGQKALGQNKASQPIVPDLRLEAFALDYGFKLLPPKGQPMLDVRQISVKGAEVRALLKDGRLYFGALDQIIQTNLNQRKKPQAVLPTIRLDDVHILLATDYGRLDAMGQAYVAKGEVLSLNFAIKPGLIRGLKGFSEINSGSLQARRLIKGQKTYLDVAANLNFGQLKLEGISAQDTKAQLAFLLPVKGLSLTTGAMKAQILLSAKTLEHQTTKAAEAKR
jgi:hypothetical protein